AEDGIRDGHVTGVQTCALPILRREAVTPTAAWARCFAPKSARIARPLSLCLCSLPAIRLELNQISILNQRREMPSGAHTKNDGRSEERRVGKEGRYSGQEEW